MLIRKTRDNDELRILLSRSIESSEVHPKAITSSFKVEGVKTIAFSVECMSWGLDSSHHVRTNVSVEKGIFEASILMWAKAW
jgi:hypothetical protein